MVQRPQNRLFQMVNSWFYKIRCLGGSETSKSVILDGKQLILYKIRCLGGLETSKSVILDGKQLFL